MLVALPVFQGDAPKLENLLTWIHQLGGCKGHRAVIVADAGMNARDVFTLKEEAHRSFDAVDIVSTKQPVSGWPTGPNALFMRAMEAAQTIGLPWLFLEPDAAPLKAGWLDTLEIHYRARGHRYFGSIVPCSTPGLPARHLSGVAVYPEDAWTDMHAAIENRPNVAFDISTAEIAVPQSMHSYLFQFLWGEKDNPPTFADKGIPHTAVFNLGYIRPDAVIFHRQKDGTLINLLRKKLFPKPKQTFIQLGRFGDIILLLPALKYIADTTGQNPRLIVSYEYASVLEGVSYVEPVVLPVHYYSGMPTARQYADKEFGGGTVLQCYAEGWPFDPSKWPNFMTSMWDRTGVSVDLMNSLPLVFDRRQPERELKIIPSTNGKPYILVSHKGISSPFAHGNKLIEALLQIESSAHLLDISDMKAPRIFDMLGVMDKAVGMVTIDSANLHLAYGCKRPFVAITVDGWCSSIPRGNCSLEVKYSQFQQRLHEIVSAVKSWI